MKKTHEREGEQTTKRHQNEEMAARTA